MVYIICDTLIILLPNKNYILIIQSTYCLFNYYYYALLLLVDTNCRSNKHGQSRYDLSRFYCDYCAYRNLYIQQERFVCYMRDAVMPDNYN